MTTLTNAELQKAIDKTTKDHYFMYKKSREFCGIRNPMVKKLQAHLENLLEIQQKRAG